MAAGTTLKTQGARAKETKNAVVYTTAWGSLYVPKSIAEQLGNPATIELQATNTDA